MSTEESRILCNQCGAILPEANTESSRPPCPYCGSTDKVISIVVEDSVQLFESVKTKQKDATGFVKNETIEREKFAGKSRRKAKEFLEIDRSDPKFTRKHHLVKELNEHGEFETKHNETKDSPAKHRPKE